MKLLLKLLFLLIIIIFVLQIGGYGFFSAGKENKPILFEKNNGFYTIKIREEEKERLKIIFKKLKDLVYQEATNHNPEGDVLPDQIDNDLIKEVKDRVN